MNIIIRKETQKDYNGIAETCLLAFRKRKPGPDFFREMILGDVLRHVKNYDNDLALVAEVEGIIVGYALFVPVDMYIRGELVKAVNLSPLAVHPEYQNQGVGGKLLMEGHKVAKEKGYAMSTLFGEKDYYPRFGYRAKMFSPSGLKISKEDLPQVFTEILERPVEPQDIKEIIEIWHNWNKDEPLAVFPGNNFLDWVSHERELTASTLIKEGEITGYIRYEVERPWVMLSLIGKNKESTSEILAHVGKKIEHTEAEFVHIPLNPSSDLVKDYLDCNYIPNVFMSIYGMIKILDEYNQTVLDYFSYIEESEENVAVFNSPPAIEWA